MIGLRTIGYWLLVSVSGLLPSGVIAAPAAATFPVLETPAVISTKATNAAILSVTRAGSRLVAVGERGIVLLSDDGGRNWRQIQTPVSIALTAAQFVSESTGWAVGHFGVVLHTKDGGETWTKQLNGQQAAQLALKAAKKQVEAGAEGAERALREANYLVTDGPDKPFLDILFVNETTGYIIGAYNLIFRTDDGGETWTSWQAHVENPGGMHLYGIRKVGDSLYIAGEQGLLLKSNLQGERFEALPSPYEGSYFGLVADQQDALVIFGLRGNTFRSADQGQTWTKMDIQREVSISGGVRLSDGGVALVSQTGELFVADATGETFKPLPLRQPMPATSLIQAEDGAVIIGSLRGLARMDLSAGQ